MVATWNDEKLNNFLLVLVPLTPDLIRQDELYAWFSVNTIGENPTLCRMTKTLAHQMEIERLIKETLKSLKMFH